MSIKTSIKTLIKQIVNSSLFKKKNVLCLICVLFLSACQNKKNAPALSSSETAQLKMLVSVVAGSKALKTQCNRFDIPEDSKLFSTALEIAKDKGWDVDAYSQIDSTGTNKIELATTRVYTKLTSEIINSEDISSKCNELSELLDDFISKANS